MERAYFCSGVPGLIGNLYICQRFSEKLRVDYIQGCCTMDSSHEEQIASVNEQDLSSINWHYMVLRRWLFLVGWS